VDYSNFEAVIETPIGRIGLLLSGNALTGLKFLNHASVLKPHACGSRQSEQAAHQLARWFRNPKEPFTLAIDPKGTAFQLKVWRQLRRIPLGQTRSYGVLAKQIGTSPRALAAACRANPIPIITPCHRVVAATGLGGYGGKTAGRNITIKQWLLRHEGVLPPQP